MLKKALKEKWTKLYEVAMNVVRLEPWKWIVEERLIVCEAYEGLQFYMSVMGMSGLFEGIMLCTSKNAIRNYNEMQCSRMPDLFGINYQEGILMVFNDEKVCLPENVKIANEFMPRKINNKIITFESFVKGYMPSKLTEEELDDAILAFETLEKTLTEFDKIGKKSADENTDFVKKIRDMFLSDPRNALYIKYDEDEDRLDINADLPPDIDDFLPSLTPPDEVIEELKNCKKTNSTWELELLNYLPIPVGDFDYKNPFMNETISKIGITRYCIVADRTKEEILHFAPWVKPSMSNKDEFEYIDDKIATIFDLFESNGLPKEIIVRDENTYTLFIELCNELKIKLKQDECLVMSDDFLYGFFEHVTGESVEEFEGMSEEDFKEYLDNLNDEDDDDNPFDDEDY